MLFLVAKEAWLFVNITQKGHLLVRCSCFNFGLMVATCFSIAVCNSMSLSIFLWSILHVMRKYMYTFIVGFFSFCLQAVTVAVIVDPEQVCVDSWTIKMCMDINAFTKNHLQAP